MNSVLKWLRKKDDETLDPTGIYKQLDSSPGKKLGQLLEDRAEDLGNALNWMCARGLDPTYEEEEECYPSKVRLVLDHCQNH